MKNKQNEKTLENVKLKIAISKFQEEEKIEAKRTNKSILKIASVACLVIVSITGITFSGNIENFIKGIFVANTSDEVDIENNNEYVAEAQTGMQNVDEVKIERNDEVITGNYVTEEIYSVEYNSKDYKDLPINYTEACYAYDTSTPEKAIGVADYVFIAKINSILRTEYRFGTQGPYTVYSATVIQNIKGEIIKNENIEIVLHGGLNKDKSSYSFMSGMDFLNVGEYYILLPYTASDGRLGISNRTSIVSLGKLNQNTVKTLKDTTLLQNAIENADLKRGTKAIDIVSRYMKAAENPIIPEGKTHVRSHLYDIELNK